MSGCATNIAPEDRLSQTDWTVPQYSQPGSQVCLPPDGQFPCYCFVCQNHTAWPARLIPFLKGWFDSSLKGGECNFEECNADTFSDLLTDPDVLKDHQQRVVMFGNGPSFTSTDHANLYCSYSLQIATKWMKGLNDLPRVPRASRAECWLDRNVLPVFIYYTGGQRIDATRTAEIAQELDGVGPALVTTEVDWDSSDASQVSAIQAQLDALASCDECLTVLAIRPGDSVALEKILGRPGQPSIYYDKVDLVGFGFRANDYAECDPVNIIGRNYIFSHEVLTNYSKPTIWLYAGASQGKNAQGTCDWTPEMVHRFYQQVFASSVAMASSGIVGASFYEFTDQGGPLPCAPGQGCDFGVLSGDGSQKHPAMNTWSSLCQAFGTQDYRNPVVFSKNGQGAQCDFLNTAEIFKEISYELNTDAGLGDGEVVPMEKQEKLGCGEVCVSDTKLQKPDVYDQAGKSFSSAHCDAFPIIDEFADDADVSAMYFRSVVEQESGFDPWVVSCNPTPCGTSFGSIAEICEAAGYGPDCPAHTIEADGKSCLPGRHFCAFGLAQCIDPPGDALYTAKCGGGSPYDPFNPGMSACCGIDKMRTNLDGSEKFISDNWGQLSMCSDGMKDDERGWAAYYLASLRYFGLGYESKLSDFTYQRDQNGECSGTQHFIAYLRSLGTSSPPGYDYSAEIMSRYLDAADNKCDTDCPGTN